MEEQGKDNPSPGLPSGRNANMERPQPTTIEERQVANALGQLRGEFAGSSAIREEDIKKAVEQASGGTSASEPAKPVAQEEALHNFGRIRTDEKGNPNPEDLPDSVKAVKNPENLMNSESEADALARIRAEMSGLDPEGAGGLLPSADRMMELQRRMQEQERYHEGSRISETLRTSEDPDEIVLEVRRQLGIVEGNLEDARYNNLSMIQRQLQDRAQTFRDAADPRTSEVLKASLQRRGLVERPVALQERLRRVLGRDRWEIDVNDAEKEVLNQASQGQELVAVPNPTDTEHPYRIKLNGSGLDKLLDSEEADRILRGTTELKVAPSKTLEELLRLAEVCETQAEEVSVRQKLFLGFSMYEQARGQINELAGGLFENNFYSTRITLGEWATIAEMGPSLPGERAFGDKWDMGMRIYSLLGELGGQKGDTFEEKVEKTRSAIDGKLMRRTWFQDWLSENIGDGERQRQFLNGLARHGAKNLFSGGYPQRNAKAVESWQKETRSWVASWTGENVDDSRAAENLSWRSFFMMGLPSYFDGMVGTVNGSPATADDIKTHHPDNWRKREHGANHDAGPIATIGKYDEAAKEFGVLGGRFTISVPFLQYCLPNEDADGKEILVGNMKSLWERWFEEGERFRDLPLRGFREYAWQYWLLFPGYFGGGYGHRSQGYEKSLFWLITNDMWKREPLINIGTLHSIFRTTKYALGGWAVTRGNVQGWVKEINRRPELVKRFNEDIKRAHEESKKEWEKGDRREPFKKFTIEDPNTQKVRVKGRLEELNAGEFEEVVVNPLRRRVRELILIGAITSTYQENGRVAGYQEWGEFPLGPDAVKDLRDLLVPLRAAMQSDDKEQGRWLKGRIQSDLIAANFDVDWDKIISESEKFIRSKNVRI